MKKSTYIMNEFLKVSIIFMMGLVVFFDSEMLNSVVLQDEEDLIVEEISPTVVNKSNVQLLGQVVVNDEEIESSYATVQNVAQVDYWAWPTNSNYTITSYYGYRWGKLHGAIDISGPGYGSNIYAANNGVVVTVKGGCVTGNATCNGSGGNYIVIKHNSNNYYTVYMHLKDIKVNIGQVVSGGDVIGTMGNTGNVVPVPVNSSSTVGTHLHFCLYVWEPYRG